MKKMQSYVLGIFLVCAFVLLYSSSAHAANYIEWQRGHISADAGYPTVETALDADYYYVLSVSGYGWGGGACVEKYDRIHNGQAVTSFGSGGKVCFSDAYSDIYGDMVLDGGSIYVSYSVRGAVNDSTNALVKINKSNGGYDTSFGTGGKLLWRNSPPYWNGAVALGVDESSVYIGGFADHAMTLEKRDKNTGVRDVAFASGGLYSEISYGKWAKNIKVYGNTAYVVTNTDEYGYTSEVLLFDKDTGVKKYSLHASPGEHINALFVDSSGLYFGSDYGYLEKRSLTGSLLYWKKKYNLGVYDEIASLNSDGGKLYAGIIDWNYPYKRFTISIDQANGNRDFTFGDAGSVPFTADKISGMDFFESNTWVAPWFYVYGIESDALLVTKYKLQSADNAAFVRYESQTSPGTPTNPPSSVSAGGTFTHSVVMKNTGTTTWDSTNFALKNVSPDATTWNISSIAIPTGTTVPPNGEITFTATFTAPSSAGTYDFQWQMAKQTTPGVWTIFGSPSDLANITVRSCSYSCFTVDPTCNTNDSGTKYGTASCQDSCTGSFKDDTTLCSPCDTPSKTCPGGGSVPSSGSTGKWKEVVPW